MSILVRSVFLGALLQGCSADSSIFAGVFDQNLEVTNRIYESCNRGDISVRWATGLACTHNPAPLAHRVTPLHVPLHPSVVGNKHCYMLMLSKKTWFQAKASCEKIGGYLATFTTEDEMNFVWEHMRGKFAGNSMTWQGPWIGYSDAAEEGTWQWINGEVAVTGQGSIYTNWHGTDEPDNCCGGEDCAHIAGGAWDSEFGSWNDNKCHFQLPYICEKNY